MSVLTKIRNLLNGIHDYFAPWTELVRLKGQVAMLQQQVQSLTESAKKHNPEAIWKRLYDMESDFVAKRDSMPDYAKERWAWCINQYAEYVPKYYRLTDEQRYPVFLPLVRYMERIGATVHDISINWWRLPNGQVLQIEPDFTPCVPTKSQYNRGIRLQVFGVPNNWDHRVKIRYAKSFYHSSDSDYKRSIATHRDIAKAVEALKQFWEVDRHA